MSSRRVTTGGDHVTMAGREPIVGAIAILLLQLTVYANAADPYLEILPSGEMQTKPVGSSIILTCKPKVEDSRLVQDMQWIDPHQRVIESLNTKNGGNSKPVMYTELHQDGSLSLFFNSLQEEQAGKYACRGTYARNMHMNKSVTIDTIIAITWDNAPPNQFPILGEDFAIQCQVRAKPSPSVDWLYNGELIKTNDHYIIDTYALRIKNVQESDDGIYTCRASVQTTGELQERPIRVEVHTRPSIEEIPNPISIIEGEDANIECRATGKPPPTFTWVKSLTHRNLSNTDRFTVEPVTGVLTIRNAHRDDEGEYQCSAMNAAGIASTNIQINVIIKPKIKEFENKTVEEGKGVEIMCRVQGRPPPEVTFRKLTVDKPYMMGAQPDDDRIILTNKPDDVNSETVGVLTIHDTLTSNDGLYECVAKNPGGIAHKNGHLTVEFPPSFRSMTNRTVWSWEQRPVNLTCIAESIPNATIRWVRYGGFNNEKIDNDAMLEQIGNGPTSVLRVLPIDRRYYTQYRCVAANTHGTREIMIELKEATKPGNLIDVKMAEITATTIRFDLIVPIHPDLPVETITVEYREQNDVWINAKNKTWSVGSLYVIEGLKPYTYYEFRFALRNEVGLGNWGNMHQEVTPARTVPNEPKIVTSPNYNKDYDVSLYSNQYELSWLVPPDNGEPIDMYQIKYCQIRRVAGEWDLTDNTCAYVKTETQSRTRYWLRSLSPDTFYKVELQAHNVMGFSKSSYFRFKTARESTGINVDYTLISAAGDTYNKIAVAAITTAVILLSLAI